MLKCKYCNSIEIEVISADPFGDDVVANCLSCGEINYFDKEEIENNEHNEDQIT